MLTVRPATPADIDALMHLAAGAVPALTNLPAHRARLSVRLEAAAAALADADRAEPGEECYTFVLEDYGPDGQAPAIVGTAGLRARAGAREAYYTWRRETLIHASQQLDVRREVPILSLSHEMSQASLLCAFALDARYRRTPAERLLRRARLLFAAQHPERFTPWMAVALPGWLDAAGCSPFWEAVGRRFFARDFADLNAIAGIRSKSFIAEVMPPFPLYVPLLSQAAQTAIAGVHDAYRAAIADFCSEGFTPSRHVDLFDAGALLEARFASLRSMRDCRWHPVRVDDRAPAADRDFAVLANQETAGFRCLLAPRALSAADRFVLTTAHARRLAVEPGQAVLAVDLAPAPRAC